MKRRPLLQSLAALPFVNAFAQGEGHDLQSPYEGVDWDHWQPLHSMSHQHQGQTEASLDGFLAMGYGHFAFSNYYPSKPTYPLPASCVAKHPDLVAAPNAEQHSFLDAGLHANSLGSQFATGYGSDVSAKERATLPLVHRFDGLNVFNTTSPWLGVYRLDVRIAATNADAKEKPTALLSVEGGIECVLKEGFAEKGPVHDRVLPPGNHTLYFRTQSPTLETRLVFDASALSVTQFRLMQGTNRPWRDVFREAFEKLQYPDGGGMTLNHPTGKLADYLPMLDFDPRVLGIEVWNQLTSGFGSSRGFYDDTPGPHLHFYELWDQILRTGRRCWGFFVKDHNTLGRGRNVLLVPKLDALSPSDREAAALRAYRQGTFFGSVAAMTVNDKPEVIAPYDRSEFRFTRLVIRRDAQGQASAIEVAVTGNDPTQRPNVQIRFITDQGIARIVDAPTAEFDLSRDSSGKLVPQFIRVEAFAYPSTHQQGTPLTAEMLRAMNVADISQLHDHKAPGSQAFSLSKADLRTPIPVVDMIFSQPLRRV